MREGVYGALPHGGGVSCQAWGCPVLRAGCAGVSLPQHPVKLAGPSRPGTGQPATLQVACLFDPQTDFGYSILWAPAVWPACVRVPPPLDLLGVDLSLAFLQRQRAPEATPSCSPLVLQWQ